MELLVLAIGLLILGAVAAAFGSDSRPGFAGNREDRLWADPAVPASAGPAAEAVAARPAGEVGASLRRCIEPGGDAPNADGSAPSPFPGWKRAA